MKSLVKGEPGGRRAWCMEEEADDPMMEGGEAPCLLDSFNEPSLTGSVLGRSPLSHLKNAPSVHWQEVLQLLRHPKTSSRPGQIYSLVTRICFGEN